MNKINFFFKKILLPSCLFFTILCFVFSGVLSLSKTEMSLPTINLNNLFQIFLFSLIFSASNLLFTSKKTKFGVSLLLHYLSFVANILIVFSFIGKHFESQKNALVMLIIFSLIYVIIAAIAATVRHFVVAKKNENKTYKRQFR